MDPRRAARAAAAAAAAQPETVNSASIVSVVSPLTSVSLPGLGGIPGLVPGLITGDAPGLVPGLIPGLVPGVSHVMPTVLSEQDRLARYEQAFAMQSRQAAGVDGSAISSSIWGAPPERGADLSEGVDIGDGGDVIVEEDVEAISGSYSGQAVRAQASKYGRFSFRPSDAPSSVSGSSGGAFTHDGTLHGSVTAGKGGSIFARLQVPVPPIDTVRAQHADGRFSLFDVDPKNVSDSIAIRIYPPTLCFLPPGLRPPPSVRSSSV